MTITKAKYMEETLNWVQLTFDDGSIGQTSVTDGIRRQYTDVLQAYLDGGGTIEPQYTDAELFDIAKRNAISRISKGFDGSLESGTFVSTQLGIEVDNRRIGKHNDKDNLQTLINLGSYPIDWVGTTAMGTLADETEALALRTEMELDGLAKYKHKWAKEQEIETATTIADLDLVVW